MRYIFARKKIMTGDLIAFRKRSGILPMLTRWITGSPYTHTAVAIWITAGGVRRLLVAESNGAGSSLSPLSGYRDLDFDVYCCPVPRDLALHAAWRILGRKVHYGFADLIRIAANRLLRWPLPDSDDDNLICSAFSAAIYTGAGWKPTGLPSIAAPDDVVAAMQKSALIKVRRHD